MVSPDRQAAAQAGRQARFNTRLQWFGDQVARGIRMTVRQRLTVAAQMLRDKVVINISNPVTKTRGGRGGGGRSTKTRVEPASRSRSGDFPKADTTRLMKDIFYEVNEDGLEAIVGTTLDYGLILETRMGRSFLVRTLNELGPQIARIITGGGA